MDVKRAQPWLGTLVEISAGGNKARQAVDAAFAMVGRIHRLMSFYETDSDVSRINSAVTGCPLSIDPHTFAVLSFALHLSRWSDGAFDVAVGGVLVKHGFLPDQDLPTPQGELGNYQDMSLLEDGGIELKRQVRLDLGGIAKGYAVDCAVEVLQRHGIHHGQVNAGGDLRVFGASVPVHLRHPNRPGWMLAIGELNDCALASSSGYYIQRDGKDPLVNPLHQACMAWKDGISVIAPTCMAADALTKVVRLLPQRCEGILLEHDAQAIVIDGKNSDVQQIRFKSMGKEIL